MTGPPSNRSARTHTTSPLASRSSGRHAGTHDGVAEQPEAHQTDHRQTQPHPRPKSVNDVSNPDTSLRPRPAVANGFPISHPEINDRDSGSAVTSGLVGSKLPRSDRCRSCVRAGRIPISDLYHHRDSRRRRQRHHRLPDPTPGPLTKGPVCPSRIFGRTNSSFPASMTPGLPPRTRTAPPSARWSTVTSRPPSAVHRTSPTRLAILVLPRTYNRGR
jgi:hypothetical protein